MAHHEPVASSREAPVGNEAYRVAEPGPDDRRGGRQHLSHPRASLWTLVADHDDVPRDDPPGEHSVKTRLLGVEHSRGAREARLLHAGDLRHTAFRCEVAAQNGEMTLGVER